MFSASTKRHETRHVHSGHHDFIPRSYSVESTSHDAPPFTFTARKMLISFEKEQGKFPSCRHHIRPNPLNTLFANKGCSQPFTLTTSHSLEQVKLNQEVNYHRLFYMCRKQSSKCQPSNEIVVEPCSDSPQAHRSWLLARGLLLA